ncbi:MAG: AraC family transcriptional regulator [Spirochaetaceae bacterium]
MANNKQNSAELSNNYTSISFRDNKILSASDLYILKETDITYLHYHDYLEIGYCLKGHGVFNINNHLLGFEPGDVVIIPSGFNHLAMSLPNTESSWIWLYPHTKITEIYKNLLPGVLHWTDHYLLTSEVKMLTLEYKNRDLPHYDKRIESRLHIILSEYHLILKTTSIKDLGENITTSPLLSRAIQIIYKQSAHGLTVERIAEQCNITPSGLYRIFQKELNCSPKTYIDRYRVRMACGSLKTKDSSISYIAHSLGFGSISSFNRTFKRITGFTPSKYIKRLND